MFNMSYPARWFLSIGVGFSVVFAVNIFMVFQAYQTHVGVIEDNAYERGMRHQEVIEKRAELLKRGIEIQARFESSTAGTPSLVVMLSRGELSEHEVLNATLKRASDPSLDQECMLTKTSQAWRCPLNSLEPGLYLLNLTLSDWGEYQQSIQN